MFQPFEGSTPPLLGMGLHKPRLTETPPPTGLGRQRGAISNTRWTPAWMGPMVWIWRMRVGEDLTQLSK